MNLRSAKKLLRLENLLLWINSVNLLINGSYLPPNKSLLLAARTLLELNCRLLVTDGKAVSIDIIHVFVNTAYAYPFDSRSVIFS